MDRFGVPAILNSDQGSLFTNSEYKQLLKQLHIRQSMDGKSHWADNIIIERWFRSLKTELIYINEFTSPQQLGQAIRGYMEDYNSLRPHEALDYKTPDSVYHANFCAA
ncbi:integrase core domain-containing protein [Allofournierella massiliensis]|uniref:integrase core domain-containing protein n=1 Tax=Allofournierella massiliensis TaxID=1650663 RepID=UPI0024B26DA9|nr:integrase core domain-containing protein [Fournierella massiliensis]